MSIIHKALKKAEESSGRGSQPRMRASVSEGRAMLGRIAAGVCALALVIALVLYLFPSNKKQTTIATAPPMVPSTVVTKQVQDVSALAEQAEALINEGLYAEAESFLKKASGAAPDTPSLHNSLGLAFRKQGKLTEAESEYRKALDLKPDYYEAMNNLAVTLEGMGEPGEAELLYKQVLAAKPSIAAVHLNYALMLESQGRTEEAESRYHTFLTLSKDNSLKDLVRRRLRGLK